MLHIKPGVSLAGIRPEMVIAAIVVRDCYAEQGYSCMITSGTEVDSHSLTSLHHVGLALDFRTRHVDQSVIDEMIEEIRRRLDIQYDVIKESTHLHIEYQPQRVALA